MKISLRAGLLVAAVVKSLFVRDYEAVVVASVAYDGVCCVAELGDGSVEKLGVAFGHLKFDRDSTPNLHMACTVALFKTIAPAWRSQTDQPLISLKIFINSYLNREISSPGPVSTNAKI